MAKRIVHCADGTWQLPVDNTNVYRIYQALQQTADQVVFYDDGIGADATGLNRTLQGGLGSQIFQKVQDGYASIASVYQPGDMIHLIGFSRGAYTARSIAGMIANCGMVTAGAGADCVAQVFAAYRNRANRASILAGLGACNLVPATIQMVGVWDTVGSLGIPAIYGGIDEDDYGFLDTTLHPDIKNAFHCMAIDEVRAQFQATLWTGAAAPGQTLEQVWFSGCHGDVGGGTALGGGVDQATRLCDITMGYMMTKAQSVGLAMTPESIAQFGALPAKFALDLIRESWAPLDGQQHRRPIDPAANVANSVAVRVQYALDYTPPNLRIDNNLLADSYNQIAVVDVNAF